MHGRLFICYLNDSERQNEVPAWDNKQAHFSRWSSQVGYELIDRLNYYCQTNKWMSFVFFLFSSKPFFAEAVEEQAFDF